MHPKPLKEGNIAMSLTEEQIKELPALIDTTTGMKILGCSRRYFCELCQRGKIKAVKLGKAWRINTDSLLAFAGLK